MCLEYRQVPAWRIQAWNSLVAVYKANVVFTRARVRCEQSGRVCGKQPPRASGGKDSNVMWQLFLM